MQERLSSTIWQEHARRRRKRLPTAAKGGREGSAERASNHRCHSPFQLAGSATSQEQGGLRTYLSANAFVPGANCI